MLRFNPRGLCAATALGATLFSLLPAAAGAAVVRRPALGAATAHLRSAIEPRYAAAIRNGAMPLVYVSNFSNGTVLAYPTGTATAPTSPVEVLSGLAGPGGLAVDANGNLYVVEESATDVQVFRPGALTPFETLVGVQNGGIATIAVDAHGTVYLPQQGGGIAVYMRGATTPSYTLNDPSLGFISGIAVDGTGNVLVTSFNSNSGLSVGAFPGSTSVGAVLGVSFFHRLNVDSAGTPYGLVIDKRGNLIVGNTGGNNNVGIYPPDVQTARTTFFAGVSGFPNAFALTAGNHHVFVAPQFTTAVYEYAYPSGTFEQQIVLPTTTNPGPTFVYGVATFPASSLGTW